MYKNVSTDDRRAIMMRTMPTKFCGEDRQANQARMVRTMTGFHCENIDTYVKAIVELGEWWLRSSAGQAYKAYCAAMKESEDEYTPKYMKPEPKHILKWIDEANGLNKHGIELTRYHVIYSLRHALQGCRTVEAPEGCIGWLEDTHKDTFTLMLSSMNGVVEAILFYVMHEAPRPGSVQLKAVKEHVAGNSVCSHWNF